MPAFTTNQWAIIGLVLVLGWLLGLLSRSGGKWKRKWQEERDRRVALEEANSTHDARIKAANERIAELERHAPAIGMGTAGAIGAAARGGRDDLSLIRGIGRSGETRLNDLGIHRYRDITALSADDEAALEGRLGAEPGMIARERWREQADLLARGKVEDHARTYV